MSLSQPQIVLISQSNEFRLSITTPYKVRLVSHFPCRCESPFTQSSPPPLMLKCGLSNNNANRQAGRREACCDGHSAAASYIRSRFICKIARYKLKAGCCWWQIHPSLRLTLLFHSHRWARESESLVCNLIAQPHRPLSSVHSNGSRPVECLLYCCRLDGFPPLCSVIAIKTFALRTVVWSWIILQLDLCGLSIHLLYIKSTSFYWFQRF